MRLIYSCLALLLTMMLIGCVQDTRQSPFADLLEEEVLSVTCLFGTQTPEELEQAEQTELIEHLRQVKIGRSASEPVLEGGTGISEVMFALHMADGSTVTVSAVGDQFIWDGTAYTSDYEDCQALLELYARCID